MPHYTESTNDFLRILPVFDAFPIDEAQKCQLAHLVVERLIELDCLPRNKRELFDVSRDMSAHPSQSLGAALLAKSGFACDFDNELFGPFMPAGEVIRLPFGNGHEWIDDGVYLRAV
jgi:hypothetical protein